MMALALAFAAVASAIPLLHGRGSSVSHSVWTARELAVLERVAASDSDKSVLVRFDPPETQAFRSVGAWWRFASGAAGTQEQVEHGELRACFLYDETEPLWAACDEWVLPVSADLTNAKRNESGGHAPLGATISGLLHSYHTHDPATAARAPLAVRVRFPAAMLEELAEFAVVWIPDTHEAPFHHTPHARPAPSAGVYPKPDYVTRAEWGADPSGCTSYSSVTHLALHHTAGANEYSSPSETQCAANVRAVQDYHKYTNGWCDVGYQWLICVHGVIWEARPGDDIVGAHDGYNRGSMAQCIMGYFHTPYNHAFNTNMRNAFKDMGAWKASVKGINPYGNTYYAGYGSNMTTVYGHRDVSATACPGDTAYVYLDDLRSGIASRLGSSPPPSGPSVGDKICFFTATNIRSGPCTSYSIVTAGYPGDTGTVVGGGQTTCSYTWYQVSVKGVTGYAAYNAAWWDSC
eukprot:TRINITY_DN4860_c0_g1_i2.p1 TRINITY_DN4860_c0_g1~~TRINITY_DN4860_c0_g1_i2.p1  ORF type:complete len:462 (-),score=93.31 TRINITY_DN4860_c0_g1_i2:72-1457(-)